MKKVSVVLAVILCAALFVVWTVNRNNTYGGGAESRNMDKR